MTLVRWDVFGDLTHRRFLPLFGSDDGYGAWVPAVDIFEKGDDLVIRAEVPGVEKSDIEVRVEDNTLVLKGERNQEKGFEENNAYRLERSYGSFVRSFRLPKTVDASRIAAEYRAGVLAVTLPKAEDAKPKKIDIKVA